MSFRGITASLLVALLFIPFAKAQKRGELPIEEVIRRFTAAESANRIARNNYGFVQDFNMREIGMGGQVVGDFRRVSEIIFDDRGNRIEKITHFPQSTLQNLQVSDTDIKDLGGIQPFALTTEDLPKYQVDYVGKEKIDELNTYAFDIKPKKLVKGERYLTGRIWVDDQDLQVVKVKGQAVPDDKLNKYPHFESYRENIDGKYWFPTYVYADDVLPFQPVSVHIRMVVKYTNYKRFGGNIRIEDDSDETPAKPKKP